MVVLVMAVLLAALIGPVVAIVLLLEGNHVLYGLLAFFAVVAAVLIGVLKAFSGPGKDVLVPTGSTYGGRSASSYQAHGNPRS